MNYFTTSLLKNLLTNDKNLPEFENVLTELFRSELEKSINEILEYELTEFLEYNRYERSDNANARNGSYSRTLQTKYGQLSLKIPRDRFSEFFTSLLPKYQRKDNFTEKTIIDLYDKGMTNSEIVDLVEKLCGAKYSKQTVSNITNKVISNVEAFKKRPLSREYAVIYTDATCMALRRDTVAKEAINIAIGIRTDGTKEILGYSVVPNESANAWKELFDDLKSRGLQRVSLVCTDGLAGIEEIISESFPGAKIQRCLVHISRNIASKVRVSDRKEIMEDFKEVYNSKDANSAHSELERFLEKWGKKYIRVRDLLKNNHNLFTFYEYPASVRKSIYTTNLIEGYNKQLKKYFKKREQFPNETSLEKFLVSQFEQYNQKFMNRIHKGFSLTTYDEWFEN